MARVRSVSTARRLDLSQGFRFAEASPGAATTPEEAAKLDLAWLAAEVPGTAASSLRALQRYCDGDRKSFDSSDFWYRFDFQAVVLPLSGERTVLHFEGLATLSEVWLDGHLLLRCDSMWATHAIDITGRLSASSELWIRFAALDERLREKRPRPRYKTRLVRRQELRFIRASLIGRMPGWSPSPAPVGPFRPIWLSIGGPAVDASMRASLEGEAGIVEATLSIDGHVERAEVLVDGRSTPLNVTVSAGTSTLQGKAMLNSVEPWWPHTHGLPRLYQAVVRAVIDGREVEIDLGRVGFRSLSVDRTPHDRGFGLVINGVSTFARGAAFTPIDTVSLGASEAAYRKALEQVRRAGMNMIRLSGTLIYESPILFDLCDELGILVWQDFMFANMDYPQNEEFLQIANDEARSILDAVETSPSLVVVAGGSEVAQQASMLGLDRTAFQPMLFENALSEVALQKRPDVSYLPSTPWGGALPFRADSGVSHYYGVGAYLRDLGDARRADVRFAAECLAFSNVPSPRSVDALLAGGESPTHPIWKERVPRDHGSGWDFEDVRDHYVARLFNVAPNEIRYADADRYLALGRAATGEIMASTFSEWRRGGSSCRGALIWLLRDLWPGAGFGLIEASGLPKSCYFAVARVLQPVSLLTVDEGLNGLRFIAVNDRARPVDATIEVSLFRRSAEVRKASASVRIPARGEHAVDVEELLGAFADPTHAYRFGPAVCDVTVAKLTGDDGHTIATAFHFPIGYESGIDTELDIQGTLRRDQSGSLSVALRANRLALFVSIDVPGYLPEDDAFHVEPGGSRIVRLTPLSESQSSRDHAPPRDPPAQVSGTLSALNASRTTRLVFAKVDAP